MDGNKEKQKNEDGEALKKNYGVLKHKYDLPDFDELSKDFQIENIDEDSNILRGIMSEMHDTIEFYSRILEGLIQPDAKLCDMKEAGMMNEQDNELVAETYRKCMFLNRELLLANLEFDESDSANKISQIQGEWQSIKKNLKLILTKMRNTWQQENKKETYGGYYG